MAASAGAAALCFPAPFPPVGAAGGRRAVAVDVVATPDTIGMVGGGALTRWYFFIAKLFWGTGGAAWVVSGGEKPVPVVGGVNKELE